MVEKPVRLENNVESQLKTTTRKLGGILKPKSPIKSLETVPEYATASHLESRNNSFISGESEKVQPKSTAVNEEQQKFNTLCQGVQSCMALFQTSMAELLALKDELLKHALPPSLLVKVTLVSAKLFRSASDLSVPIGELVRLVKLYSAPWEAKSAALKKLHEDYENKQRQLNVALQKLVLVGIQSDRMAKERRVLNWEKLFSRMMTSKAHGYRWKFLIDSFKQKAKTGEIFAAGSSSDEEEVEKERKKAARLDAIKRRSMSQRSLAISPTKSILQGSVKGSASPESVFSRNELEMRNMESVNEDEEILSDVDMEMSNFNLFEEKKYNSFPGRSSRSDRPRFGTSSQRRKTMNMRTSKRENLQKMRFLESNDDDDEDRNGFSERAVKSPIPAKFMIPPGKKPESSPKKSTRNKFIENDVDGYRKKRPIIRFFGESDEEKEEFESDSKLSEPQPSPVVKVDQACWTEEPDYERYLHVRLFRAVCLKAESPYCTITFGDQIFRSGIYPEPSPPVESLGDTADNKKKDKATGDDHKKQKTITGLGTSEKTNGNSPSLSITNTNTTLPAVETPQFEEFVFKLPDNKGYSLGEKKPDIDQEQLKIAVHPAENTPMIAFAGVRFNELMVKDEFEGRWSHTSDVPANNAQQLQLFSLVSERDMPFNSNCGHVPVVCYESKIEKLKKLTKGTDTVSFEELVNDEIEERKRKEKEGANQVSEPLYTEGDLNALRDQHAEELQLLQNEFQLRINEFSKGLGGRYAEENGDDRTFINVATSPIFMRSPSPKGFSQSEQGKTPRPPSDARGSPKRHRPKIANLPEWGKDLPQDFLVRLQMFAENSEKYRQQLGDKTKRAIQEKYEQQMAVHNRLDVVDEEAVLNDICLPALFMPTRMGHVYTPKAHSYFHPSGSSEARLTQPPAMFKLPSLSPESQISVLNLFDMGKTFLNTGPRSDWGEDYSRPHTTGEPRANQCFPSSTMGLHSSPSTHFDRSKTR